MIGDLLKIILSMFNEKLNRDFDSIEYTMESVMADPGAAAGFIEVTDICQNHESSVSVNINSFQISVFAYPVIKKILYDPRLKVNLVRLVHAGQQIRIMREIGIHEKLNISSSVESVFDTPAGEILDILTKVSSSDSGEILMNSSSSFLIRRKKLSIREKRENTTDFSPVSEYRFLVPLDQSRRYAKVSGDRNPIHTSKIFARAAGLPGPVLHGMCTLAMTGSVLINKLCSEKLSVMSEISARFSAYVVPGEFLTVEIGKYRENTCFFRVRNSSGREVIKDGKFTAK